MERADVLLLFSVLTFSPYVFCATKISYISPHYGSLNGATKITIWGSDFAENQFNFGDDSDLGNKVKLVSETRNFECDILRDECTTQRVVCYTRAMPDDNYYVRVSVDGTDIPESSHCNCNGFCYNCEFRARWGYTPSIASISPKSTLPGSIITIKGNLYTGLYGTNIEKDDYGRTRRIKRVYVGGSKCELRDPDAPDEPEVNDELYGLELNNNGRSNFGSLKCKIEGSFVGNVNVSFIVDENYGRSIAYKILYDVKSQGKIAMLQTYAAVDNVSPSVGSLMGETKLTISGRFFDETNFPAKVYVAGQPCEVESLTISEIVCLTPAFTEEMNSTVYPGNRGVNVDVFKSSLYTTDLSAVQTFTADDIAFSNFLDSMSFSGIKNNRYNCRIRAYFVPPKSSNYTFYGKDFFELFFSSAGPPEHKVLIAHNPKYSNSYSDTPSQKSETFYLEEGMHYYMEVYHRDNAGADKLSIATLMHESQYTSTQSDMALNEKQKIMTTSSSIKEKQMIQFKSWPSSAQSWTKEVQRISLQSDFPDVFVYRIGLYGVFTAALKGGMDAKTIKEKVNELLTIAPDTVSIAKQATSGGFDLVVAFNSKRGDFPALEVVLDESSPVNATFVIMEETKGVPNMMSYVLSVGGVPIPEVLANAQLSEVEAALNSALTVRCPEFLLSPTAMVYYQDYEISTDYAESGTRSSKIEPFCGQVSSQKPGNIFSEGSKSPNINAFFHKYICFAYHGEFQQKIYIKYYYYKLRDATKYSTYKTFSGIPLPEVNSWGYTCVDMKALITSHMTSATSAILRTVSLVPVSSYSQYYVDTVVIAATPVTEDYTGAAKYQRLRPQEWNVKSFTIEGNFEDGFNVTFNTRNCHFDIPLLGMEGTATSTIDMDSATYTLGGVTIDVTRLTSASMPPSGTFGVSFGRYHLDGIAADLTAEEMQVTLETITDIGSLQVERTGTCAGYTWAVEWLTKPGDQVMLEITDTSDVGGTDATVSTEAVQDGGIFFDPIPGDMLRSGHSEPQVTVIINKIASICAGNCSFEYSLEATPTVSTVEPTSGSLPAGTLLTITGTGFDDVGIAKNTIVIGGVNCDVTVATATSITCAVGEGPAGTHEVFIFVVGKGAADTKNQTFYFTYDFTITGFSPSSGSTAGGQELMISGTGFGPNITATVGSSDCEIVSANYSVIMCITTQGTGSQKISVSDGGTPINYTTSSYTYDSAITPQITTLSSTTGSPIGGAALTITGLRFGTSSDSTVFIGDHSASVVEYTDTAVKVTLPDLPPGQHSVVVLVDGIGQADNTAVSAITSVLEVNNVFPTNGSQAGGTIITITGQGFQESNANLTSISIGDRDCPIVNISSTQITCVTSDTLNYHRVTNQGVHPTYGENYAWLPSTLHVDVGDVVTWSWASPERVTTVGYAVHQTATPTSEELKDGGFTSGAKTAMGSFSYKFNKPGNYYYWSDKVNNGGTITMRGTVVVHQRAAALQKVNVTLNGHEAEHKMTGVDPTDTTSCGATYKGIAMCNEMIPTPPDMNSFCLTTSRCGTPKVTSVEPNIASASDVFHVHGEGFSDVLCQNTVMFGDVMCNITSANETLLTCEIDNETPYAAGTPLEISASVANLGDAIIEIEDIEKRNVFLLPMIVDVKPESGSIEGHTSLTISGSGFSESLLAVTANINGVPCEVTAVAPDCVICLTGRGYAKSNLTVALSVFSGGQWLPAECHGDCKFSYELSLTPVIYNVSVDSINAIDSVIVINGTGFSNSENHVFIGDTACTVSSSTSSEITCNSGTPYVGTQPLEVIAVNMGKASGQYSISIEPAFTLSPSSGSTAGGQHLTISGFGFMDDVTVEVGDKSCEVISVTVQEVVCLTPDGSAGAVDVDVTSNSYEFPSVTYTYSASVTPTISTVSPATGLSGTNVVITGTNFGTNATETSVTIGGVKCSVSSVKTTTINCVAGAKSAGEYLIDLQIYSLGKASNSMNFTYELSLTSVSPTTGSFAGGQNLTVNGNGFDMDSIIEICDQHCEITSIESAVIYCFTPSNNATGATEVCGVTVSSGLASASLSSAYTYDTSLTPDVTDVVPKRGGTGGGTVVTITGTGFGTSQAAVSVSFAGTDCPVSSVSSTEIVCTTEAHSPSIETKAVVEINGNGIAKQSNADFQYIDVWSSKFTWGGLDPPVAGDFVVIPSTMTVLLDTVTPVLAILLVDGGKLIFDEKDVELHAEKILVTNGGLFQVGTEAEPFMHKATIMLHGHVRSQELPIYGTKMLAVRNGTLDLHGKPRDITWTLLGATANAGDTTITLQLPVDWEIGDEIVIATTGTRHTQGQTEVKTIVGKSADNSTLTLDSALKYKHMGESLPVNGENLEARAEVGLLTRNVVVRGNNNADWNDEIEACPDGFNTGEFATQTCFQGRFGDEIGTDEFGSQIMLSAPYKHSGLVIGRISNIEVTHAGQAYRLGRYAIHFHLNGDMNGSYVKNCAIHKSFNRAINLHGTNYVLIENNVIYDIMGGAVFLEDGIEIGNVFRYNLVLFVKASTSLQNDDITPAAFWVTNANNTYQHNHAAGGTHFGFWYRMHSRPDGASYTNNYCPQKIPMGAFFNNTVHSQGWFGIWIFQEFYPMENGLCNGGRPLAARFVKLTAWNNEKGVEGVSCGAIQFVDFFLVSNEVTAIEFKLISQAEPYSNKRGAAVTGGLIAACPDDPNALSTRSKDRTNSAIILPYSRGMMVQNTTFYNFNGTWGKFVFGITSITGTSSAFNGGYTYHVSGLTYVNSAEKVSWRWASEGVIKDLDGTTCGTPGCKVVPAVDSLPPAHCTASVNEFSVSVPGAVCDDTVTLHRWAFNNPSPSSLKYKDVTFTNLHGTTVSKFAEKRVTHKPGWHTLLVSGDTYIMQFDSAQHITNISYSGTFYNLKATEFVILQHNFTQSIDRAKIIPGASFKNASSSPLDENSYHGAWYKEEDSNMVSYIVSGRQAKRRRGVAPPGGSTDREISLSIERCFYADCVLPLFGGDGNNPVSDRRPADAVFWENKGTWEDSQPGWGGYYGDGDYGPPMANDDVIIPAGKWVVLRTAIPQINKLYVYGVLEFEYLPDSNGNFYNLTLSATHIVITGRLIVGWGNDPFLGSATIELRGNHLTPDIVLGSGSIGSKVIAAFGGLEIHGKPHNVTWTQLASTAPSGSDRLKLTESADWEVGDEIVITPSGFSPFEVEIRAIAAISGDGMTLTLNESLTYPHTVNYQNVGTSNVYLGSEVGLLSRNVKIVGAEYPDLFKQSFGARILIGTHLDTDGMHAGYAKLSDFECYHCGQEGWTDSYDPRYSLAFLNSGEMTGEYESYVRKSSFFHSFSPAIGLFGANQVQVENNVIYHTVGSAIIDESVNNAYRSNLVSFVLFPGTYNGRIEKRSEFYAAIEIQIARLTILENNVVSGSERAGYTTAGEPCINIPHPVPYWSGNVAHSSLFGVAILPQDPPLSESCAMWSNFTTYRCHDYGFYYQSEKSFELVNSISIDNQLALYDHVIGPSSSSHSFARKTVVVRNTVIVGTSDGFDCDAHYLPKYHSDRKMLYYSGVARSWKSPGNGRVGLAFPTFSSGGNNAPEKPFANIMAYNALYGIKHIIDTTFINFASACGNEDYAITTMPKNDDLIHPLRTVGLKLTNVKSTNRLYIHRPNLGKINPSDCVDMDCDGFKKCILTDSDGSLLGQAGTVLSQSEWEWDGDRRRGLGDYRIPKTLLMTPDGARIDVMDIAPEKGIIRDSSCVLNDNMHGWVCDDNYDYQMALIESMDSDSQTRRVSPVAVLGDGYLDLINGPQDHGWCFGYTCQKRLSTFAAVVATGKTYEVHFTGTTPQDLRLHLLNSAYQQAYVMKIFYSVPMRLDVSVAGKYVAPKNSAIDGTGQQVTLNPAFEGEYHPDITTDRAGTNFWDPTTDLLYVLVRGDSIVDIKTSELIIIAFGIPAMTVDDFFGENLVFNLATFLGIPASKIKVAQATRESRRRLLADTIEFIVEISNPPSNDTSGDGAGVPDVGAIDSTQFSNITATLINAVQLGLLDKVLNTTLSDISVTEPVPDPSDPSWSTITAALEEGFSYTLTIQVPDRLEMVQNPASGKEYSAFMEVPVLHMLDSSGNHVSQLGSKVTSWEFTANLTALSGSSDAFLTGDATVKSLNGWVNFTTLGISHEGTYRIEIEVSSPPDAVGKYNKVSFEVEIEPKSLTASFAQHNTEILENEEVSMEIEILDAITKETFKDIQWKGHNWFANLSLHMAEMYSGNMSGDITTEMFDNSTSTGVFNVSFGTRGRYYLHGHVWSVPADFRMNVVSEAIDVISIDDRNRFLEKFSDVILRFAYDYDTHVAGKEDYFGAAVMNQLSPIYTQVSLNTYTVSRGSILLSFVMSGTDTNVATSLSLLEAQFKSGFTVSFNGNSYTADPEIMIDQSVNTMTTAAYPEILDESGISTTLTAIIAVVCLSVIIVLIVIVIVIIHKKNKKKMVTHSESLFDNSREHLRMRDKVTPSGSVNLGLTEKECDEYDEYAMPSGPDNVRYLENTDQLIARGRSGSLPPLKETDWSEQDGGRRRTQPIMQQIDKLPKPVLPLPVEPVYAEAEL